MIQKLKYLIFFLIFYYSFQYLICADNNQIKQKFGISSASNFNFHSPDFKSFDGFPGCCDNYNSGFGFSGRFGLTYDYYYLKNFYINFKADYSILNSLMTKNVADYVNINDKLTYANFQQRLNTLQTYYNFSLNFGYDFNWNYSIFSGFTWSVNNLHKFDMEEKLIEPSVGTFENGMRVRNQISGIISESRKNIFLLNFGVSANLPLSFRRNYFAEIFAIYSKGLNSLATDKNWNISILTIGISIQIWDITLQSTPLKPNN